MHFIFESMHMYTVQACTKVPYGQTHGCTNRHASHDKHPHVDHYEVLTCLATALAKSLQVSVFPVPAGPSGAPPRFNLSAPIRVLHGGHGGGIHQSVCRHHTHQYAHTFSNSITHTYAYLTHFHTYTNVYM